MIQLMIADDERIERLVLRRTLEKYLGDTCQIHEAENGRQALAVYWENKIQIAILDIEMPGINGIQAAEEIRTQDPDCCIIFLTAFDDFHYAKQAVHVRAMEYLLKPYSERELLDVLDEAVRITRRRMDQVQPAVPSTPEAAAGSASQQAAVSGSPQQADAAGPAKADTSPAESGREEDAEEDSARILLLSQAIAAYVRQNYRNDISMQDAARAMNYSEAYFCKLFKQCFSCNFTAYLAEYRIGEAKKLLAIPTVNIKDIGKAVGYGDSNYFTKVFRRYTGVSPSEYRTKLLIK